MGCCADGRRSRATTASRYAIDPAATVFAACPMQSPTFSANEPNPCGQIGDPWFASTPTTTGTASFNGTFNTKQAGEPTVVTGERYFWGVEQTVAKVGGIGWTRQSLVFPLTWQ